MIRFWLATTQTQATPVERNHLNCVSPQLDPTGVAGASFVWIKTAADAGNTQCRDGGAKQESRLAVVCVGAAARFRCDE
jgi:hypothetical protein